VSEMENSPKPHRPAEFEYFEKLLDRLLAVPRAVVEQRIKEYRERSANDPHRRGPKKKKRPDTGNEGGSDG
jgi:hypothetical protein